MNIDTKLRQQSDQKERRLNEVIIRPSCNHEGKKYWYYIRIFFNICAASDKVEEHFAQQNCFEHKNLVYEILLMKYEDFMTFLHLWDTYSDVDFSFEYNRV